MTQIAILNGLLYYNQETGVLTRAAIPGNPRYNTRYAGKEITCKNHDGYVVFHHAGKVVYAHRCIYEELLGPIPDDMCIDHINKNRADNRLPNLRLTTALGNSMNRRKHPKSTTGFNCVTKIGDRFRAQVRHLGAYMHLGMYSTAEAAHAVVVLKQQELGFYEGHGE